MSGGRILVVGDNDLAGLTSVRSLGRAGHTVELVAFEPSAITRRSRYVRRIHHLGHPLREADRFPDRLLDLVRQERFDLVLPTSDKALLPLMPHRDELLRFSRFAAPDADGFAITQHKDRTIELARRLNIPVPAGMVLARPGELPHHRAIAFPVVLKPVSSVLPGRMVRNEVVIVRSLAELEARLPGLLERCPVLLQEFCPGHGVGLCVLADRGEVVAAFQHERVHEPPEGGASSYRRSVPLSPELLEAARACCRELRWTGPAMFEFKVDPGTGRAVLMEINGRLWGSLALAVRAGVDFPRLLHDLFVHGTCRPTFCYQVPCYVRHTTRDVFWLRANLRVPASRPDLLRRSLPEVLGELRHVVTGRESWDLEALDDPLPGVIGWLELGRSLARSLLREARRWRCRRVAAAYARRWHEKQVGVLQRIRQARSLLVVCAGNINRSAVAERRLRQRLAGTGIRVISGGLLQRTGRPTGPVSLRVARELGIDLSGHRSAGLPADVVRGADLVLAMESEHLLELTALDPTVRKRAWLLGAFHPVRRLLEIPDPEGSDHATFLDTYQIILECCDALAAHLATPAHESRAA